MRRSKFTYSPGEINLRDDSSEAPALTGADAAADAATGSLNYADYSILLVDDTPNNLDVLVDFLQAYGFGLRIARSGESALRRVGYDAPSLILLDVLLPGIDGFETCRQLQAEPATRDIPIIFMTSLANAEDKVRGFEAGAVDYVTKPLQQAEVLARITTHLRQRAHTQTLQAQNRQLVDSHQVEKERLLQAVAQQRSQLRTLAAKLTDVQEDERQRLARELHDEMGQALTAIRMNLAAVDKALAATASTRTRERLAEAAQLADDTLEQIRELALDLRPAMLDDLGLVPALRWYVNRFAKRTETTVDFAASGFAEQRRLSPLLETALYRILQEALTNVARHAAASRVQLHLAVEAPAASTATPTPNAKIPEVVAVIQDNGRGFDPEAPAPANRASGVGLLGMRERVTLLGGTWQLDSAPGAGTQIQIRIPLERAP